MRPLPREELPGRGTTASNDTIRPSSAERATADSAARSIVEELLEWIVKEEVTLRWLIF